VWLPCNREFLSCTLKCLCVLHFALSLSLSLSLSLFLVLYDKPHVLPFFFPSCVCDLFFRCLCVCIDDAVPLRECTQNAGDLMFVPGGWAHAVLNIQESVAVATEIASGQC